ncbi:MAG TPA: hypothetical protein DIT01_04670 [Lentisphaeria bacterium]|nr:hypothetical protein [Lentisphaeria bacterium]
MSKPRILVTSNCVACPEALEPLRRIGQVDCKYPVDRATALAVIDRYDAVMCDAGIQFDEAVLSRAERLRIIATPSTGTDHLDKKTMAARGIEWIDIAKEYDLIERFTATAEAAWLLLLACIRRLPRNFERAKRGCLGPEDWESLPKQLCGKTLGVIGHGRLGRMVTQYGQAFRMRVLVHDIRTIEEPDVEQVDLDTLLAESDVVSLHLHLKDETRRLIDRERIARMKRGVVLVNTARGDLIDEAAMIEALETGQIGAAGVDVVHDEWDPDRAGHALHEYARTHDNLIITPHIASACYESCVEARAFVAEELAKRLEAMDWSG